YADAHIKNDGGALVSVSSSSPDAETTGTTQARLLGNVTHSGDAGANNVYVTAQSSEDATAGSSSSGGGLVSATSSNVTAHSSPNVSAQAGSGQIRAAGDITIQSVSTTDADTSSKSASGGAVDVQSLSASASVNPSVSAGVGANGLLAAGGTLTISALHGAEPAPTSDGSFNAATAVNTATNTIDLGAATGLLTGDTITYHAEGNTPIGGLVDGRRYGVIFVTANALELGATFTTGGSSTAVDVTRDTIHFASDPGLQEGDSVIYNAGAFNVGGLVDGHRYLVHMVDTTTIKLIDPNNIPAPAQSFSGSSVASNIITINNNGFTNGQAVTYRAPSAATFGASSVDVVGGTGSDALTDANNDNIYLGSGHGGLANGDTVIFTASDPSKPVNGLTSGQRYVVIFDSSKPNEIQLAQVGSPTTPISISRAGTNNSETFELRKISDQAIGGLTDGVTYYVINHTTNTFQLSATPGGSAIALDPTDPVTHATLTGTSHIGTEGVDLTSAGSGTQQLVIDLTSTSSGTQQLEGVGGARALAAAPSGDGIVTSAASGSGGGIVQVGSSNTEAHSTPSVNTTIGTHANLSGNDVVVSASSIANVSASSANSGGGLVAVGSANSSISASTTGIVSLGAGASITAAHDVTLTSSTDQHASVLTDTNGGGLVDFADGSSSATLDYDSEVQIGNGATITAKHNVTAQSSSALSATADASGDAAGLGAGASADAEMNIGQSSATTRTLVGTNAQIFGADVSLQSTVTSMFARSTANADAGALISGADATANVSLHSEKTDVELDAGAFVEGDTVEVLSSHQNIDVSTRADGEASGLYGDGSGTATTDYQSDSAVDVDDGAAIAGHGITVQATQSVNRYDRSSDSGSGFFGSSDSSDNGDFNAKRDITYNGDIVLLIRPNPELSIDQDGRVIKAVGITVDGGHGVGYDVNGSSTPGSHPITIDPIGNLNVAGSALIQANTVGSQDGESAPDSTISGTQGT
ncbi:MAG TPA: hypothetical protein VL119_06675, partial [Acidimicrobiia bacterium]|nr:hypothetical protein [Acidimicrobiia bacterium]